MSFFLLKSIFALQANPVKKFSDFKSSGWILRDGSADPFQEAQQIPLYNSCNSSNKYSCRGGGSVADLHKGEHDGLPDRDVRTIRDLIHYQYAKIIARSALSVPDGTAAKGNYYRFIKQTFKELHNKLFT
jgi:hypothetical protein